MWEILVGVGCSVGVGHSVGKYVNPCTVHYIISSSCGVLVNGYLQPIEVTRIF